MMKAMQIGADFKTKASIAQKEEMKNIEEDKEEEDPRKSKIEKIPKEKKEKVRLIEYQKGNWDSLNIPKEIQHALEDNKIDRPAQCQIATIPRFVSHPDENVLYQAPTGSGKTLAFAIPSIMKVDPNVDACQVLIVVHTNVLMAQIHDEIKKVSKNTKVTTCIANKEMKGNGAHIVLTNLGQLDNQLSKRKPFDIKNVKLIVFDEADE